MTKQMNVNVLKSLMNQSGWTHEQVITINNEYDEMVEGIAEVVSRNPSAPFEIHYNEGFKYNVEKDGEKIDSWDLDEQGFNPEFSNVDYSETIENAKASQE